MSTELAVEALWGLHRQGEHFPAAWRGKLDLAEGYRVQLGLLQRHLAQGERHAGWKVGLTAEPVRALYGSREPVFGYLLDSSGTPSGHPFDLSGSYKTLVENELLFTLACDLSGPTATVEDARRAVATVAPAFEVVELRGPDMKVDIALTIADNIAQRAFVHGASIPFDPALEFGAVRVTAKVNGEVKDCALGREVIDNPLQTLAWLANALHRYGRRLEAGQRILTGSYTRPMPVAAGDVHEAEFSGIGTVRAAFR
jgi:2-keto-4-pentenoate hydratase